MKSHTFTEQDFSDFKLVVEEQIRLLGITGWQVEILHEQLGNGSCARLDFNIVSRKCQIRLTHTVEYDYALERDIDILAKHEVLHLLLADFCWTAATTGDHCCDAVISKEHELINRLLFCENHPCGVE